MKSGRVSIGEMLKSAQIRALEWLVEAGYLSRAKYQEIVKGALAARG